jgi:two-component system KDP operon response regulator KdpE
MMRTQKGVKVAEKILVIDDDLGVAELIRLILKPRGMLIYHAVDGQEGLKQAYELQPDLIILDVMMPERDGFDVCARLREFSDVPIVMLTAKSQSSDVAHGFAVGADDYVKKPFSNEELVSRIESLLRRKKTTKANTNITGYTDGYLEVELSHQKVMLQGEEITLTPTEFKLLAFLIRHPHKTLSTPTLLSEVWGNAYSHDKALLSLYIHQLRQKLKEGETEHKYIQTQWGEGYWFNPLPPTQKTSPVSIPVQEEQETTKETTLKNSASFRWGWIVLVVPVMLIAFQLNGISGFFAKSAVGSTSFKAIVTAEGFLNEGDTGVRGQICITNQGKYPTEHLSIVDVVQVTGEQQGVFTSTTIDLDQHPIIEPNKSHCYPYEITFEPLQESNAKYNNIVSATITNYSGLMPGSEYCPGPDLCSFGPTIITEFSLPEP